MADTNENLKFPLDFIKCPHCGSTRRVAEMVMKQEQEKGKIGKDAKPVLFQQRTAVMDPRKILLSFPVLFSFFDACADCGTVYCTHAELIQGTAQMKQMPPGDNMGQFGFPQNDPRKS